MSTERKHSHYFKPCPFDHVDVYRVLALFGVTDPCLQHAIKKLLVAGGRGAKADAGWTAEKDVSEAVDSLRRWQEMRAEEASIPKLLDAPHREVVASMAASLGTDEWSINP